VHAPPVLQLSEHSLDLVALAVERAVIGYLNFTVLFRWDAGFDFANSKGIAKPVGIIALVSQQSLRRRQRRQQGDRTGRIAALACGQKQGAGGGDLRFSRPRAVSSSARLSCIR